MSDRIDEVLRRIDEYKISDRVSFTPEQYWKQRFEKEAKARKEDADRYIGRRFQLAALVIVLAVTITAGLSL